MGGFIRKIRFQQRRTRKKGVPGELVTLQRRPAPQPRGSLAAERACPRLAVLPVSIKSKYYHTPAFVN